MHFFIRFEIYFKKEKNLNKNDGSKWLNINNEHLFLFFYSEKCRKKTDEFSPKWEQLYQAVPEENKTKSNSSFPKKKRDQKYMTLNTFSSQIHYFYVLFLQYHHKINPMTGILYGNLLKSHSNSPLAQPAGHIVYCNTSTFEH